MRLIKRGLIWHARYYDSEGIRQSASTHCRDRAAAEVVARRLEREAADPDHARAAKTTLTDALEEMIGDCEEQETAGKMAPETVTFYRKRAGHLLRLQVEPPILPVTLGALRAFHVDAYISRRRGEGVTDNTISKELITLRKTLKLAKRRGRWRGDIQEVMAIGFDPAYKPSDRHITIDRVPLLLRALPLKRAARVAFCIALGADVRDCDRALRVDLTERAESVHLRGTKNANRDRVVPVVTKWQQTLLAFSLEHADGKDGALFSPWLKSVRDLRLACVAADVPTVNNKDLRRSFAKLMHSGGARPGDIGAAMGHADSRMVERVYGRLSTEQLATRLREDLAVPPVRQTDRTSPDSGESADIVTPSLPEEFEI